MDIGGASVLSRDALKNKFVPKNLTRALCKKNQEYDYKNNYLFFYLFMYFYNKLLQRIPTVKWQILF